MHFRKTASVDGIRSRIIAGFISWMMAFVCIAFDASGQPETIKIDQQKMQVKNLLWDLRSLSVPPAVQWLKQDSVVASLLYSSVAVSGKPTRVFAYYSDPDRIAGRPPSGKKYPAVVLVHGGGGKAFPQWVALWANSGYAAIAMDLAGKDGAGNRLDDGGPNQSNENKIMHYTSADVRKSWSYHAVSSVILAHSLLRTFPSVRQHETFVTGISWGGYLTCMVAGLDNRFKGAVPVYGCGFLGESDVFKNQLARLQPSEQKSWLDHYDPSVYLPYASMPVLFINGNKDKHYNVVPYHKTYQLVPAGQRYLCIKPNMKHGHPPGWEPVEIKRFFDQLRHDGPPLPKVLKRNETDSTITFWTAGDVKEAAFYFSNQTNVLNEQREWQSIPVTSIPVNGMITIRKPAAGFKYAFLQIFDAAKVSTSSEFIIQ
jgi:dienelactone hydrolase